MRVVSLDAFKESLVEELGNKVAFTVPVLGGVPVAESVVVTWIVMAALIALALALTRRLSVDRPGKVQCALEWAVEFLNGFVKTNIGAHWRPFAPWLGTVARNRAADWLRTHKEAAPLPEDTAAPGGADPQAEAERREWAARLWDAVEGLDEPDRTLFLRYYYCGDKLKDIARALGLTQTAAKQRLFRGRKTLRDTLTKGGVEA